MAQAEGSGAAPPGKTTVAVAPVRGAPREATDALLAAVRGLPGVTALDLRSLRQALGPAAMGQLLRCQDDACLVRSAGALVWDELLVAELAEGGKTVRLRLLGKTPGEAPRIRVSRQVGEEGLADVLRAGTIELFPVRAALSSVPVVVKGLPAGAEVQFDEQAPLQQRGSGGRIGDRLSPGPHTVEARAPGYTPWSTSFEVEVGSPLELGASLRKRRSAGPWYVGGGGLVLAAVGAGLLASAQARVDDWDSACPSGESCAEGFTRQRFTDDASALDLERGFSTGLLVGGGAALVGAVVWYLLDPGERGPTDSFSGWAGPAESSGVRF